MMKSPRDKLIAILLIPNRGAIEVTKKYIGVSNAHKFDFSYM